MRHRILTIAALISVAMLPAGCQKNEQQPVAAQNTASVSGLAMEKVRHVETEDARELAGTVRAASISNVSARIMARVLSVRAREGEFVKAGDVLVTLDDRELQAKLRQAEGALRQAEAQRELARSTHERYKALLEGKAVSKQEYDTVAAQEKIASEAVNQAGGAVDEARSYIAFAEIRSPVSGRIVSKSIDEGSMANPGMPLFGIEPEGRYHVEIPVDMSLSGNVRTGTVIGVSIDDIGMNTRVPVSEIVPTVDPMSRTFIAKAHIPADAGLRSGQYARASVSLGKKDAITIPETAVSRRGQMDGVFVVSKGDGTMRYRIVKLGRQTTPGRIEVLSGIDAGEMIVASGTERASDGARAVVESRASDGARAGISQVK